MLLKAESYSENTKEQVLVTTVFTAILFISVFLNYHAFYSHIIINFLEVIFIYCMGIFFPKKNSDKVKPRSFFELTLIGLVVYMILSSAVFYILQIYKPLEYFQMFIRTFSLIVHIVFGATCFRYFRLNGVKGKPFLAIPIALAFLVVYYLFDYSFNPLTSLTEINRYLPFAFNRRIIGFISIVACVYLTYELLLCVQKREKLILTVLAIINFSLIIWLGGRGSWLGVVCAMLFLFVALLLTKNTNLKSILYVCSLVFISFVISLPFNIFEWNGTYRIVNLFNMLASQTIDSSTDARFEMWGQAIQLIGDRFWFGYGLDSYKVVGEFGFFQPHNFILQFGIELGFVGVLLIGYIFIAPIIKNLNLAIKSKSINPLALLFMSILGAYVVQGLLDGTFYWPHPAMLMAISIAGICSLNNDYSSQTTN